MSNPGSPAGVMTFTGAWNPASKYTPGMVTVYQGAAYVCTAPASGVGVPTFNATASATSASGTVTIKIPNTTKVGDLMLLAVMNNSTSIVPSTPSGWAEVISETYQDGSGDTKTVTLFSKTAVAADIGANVASSVSGGTLFSGMLRTYTGAGSVDNAAGANVDNSQQNPFNFMLPPTVTASAANETYVIFTGSYLSGGTTAITNPNNVPNFQQLLDTNYDSSIASGDSPIQNAGQYKLPTVFGNTKGAASVAVALSGAFPASKFQQI